MWYVYLLKCRNGAIYTGITDDVERRFKEHVSGKGGHYTGYNRPEEILYKESFKKKIDAECREQQVKRWSKVKKMALIQRDLKRLKSLSLSRD